MIFKDSIKGYGLAGLSGWAIYKLNQIFFPSCATLERLAIWVLLIGTLFTILFNQRRKLTSQRTTCQRVKT